MLPTPDLATDRRCMITAAVILLVVAGVITVTAFDPGMTWDEAIYIPFATGCRQWLQRPVFDARVLQSVWGAGQAHPPLGKLWIAFSLTVFGETLPSVRIGAGILFGIAAAAVYLWQAYRRNERVGILAAAAFILLPRVFGHGHLATLDIPMLLLWLLTTITFEKGIRSRRWSIACGVLFGLALLIKVNAVFLPLILVPWGLLFHRRKALPNIIAMAALGPLLFYAGWPAIWRHPHIWTRQYLADKTSRDIVPVWYLGVTYVRSFAPWHYPFVLLAATTPLPILAAAVAAVVRCLRKIGTEWRNRSHELLVLWSLGFQMLLFAIPGVPKYDGVRLFLPAMPFLAILAAHGAEAGWLWLRPRIKRVKPAAWGLGALAAVWLLAPVLLLHPLHLSYYSELVGGPWGARRLGFETTYYNDAFNDRVLAWIMEETRPGENVAVAAVGDFVWKTYYTSTGFRERGIRDGNPATVEWDILIVLARQGYWPRLPERDREFIRTHAPVKTWYLTSLNRVPVCTAYRRQLRRSTP